METDYGKYELSGSEKKRFYAVSYAAVFAVCMLFYHSLILSAVCGLSVYFFRDIYADHLAEKRRTELALQFRDLLYSLSASVAAGRQMGEALIEANENLGAIYDSDTPMMNELRYFARSIRENHESEEELLIDFAIRSKVEDIKNFVDVYLACRTTGADLETVIGNSTEILMDKIDIEKEIRALTAQKQFEGKIITVMPVAVVVLLNILSPDYLLVMYSTLTGRLLMTLSLAGIAVSYIMTQKLMRIEV
ncbi:MAG: type II secretion system F family protein [Eubacteriaceae bacterium]|jgi:tight adherence protein B|nr:type II secretion system F family protein [Eubacteriaceae bacterium]